MITEALVTTSPTSNPAFIYKRINLDTTLRPSECLIKISATGVCHTDLNFSRESSMPELFPCVLGHEGAGTVVSVGSAVTKVSKGDRVVCVFSCCGECKYCLRKESSYCDLWFQYNFGVGRVDGSKVFTDAESGKRIASHFFGQSSFARDVVVSENGLVRIEREVGWERLAPLGCGVMTGAGAMLNVVKPGPEDIVAVVGAGVVGLSAIMALKMLDRRLKKIIAVDVVSSRLEMARGYGATHCVNSKHRPDLMKVLMDITDGRGIDGSIDTTGKPEVIAALTHSTARKGKVVTVGIGSLSAEASFNMFEMVQAGCTYIGCNQGDCYPQEFLPKLLEANEAGKFPYDKMIQTYPAKEMERAARHIHSGKTIKAVLLWD